ncbi:MAG: 3D domain-containing protein [Clostridiales bacterium]|nr:3D domain-containing protein [Clostridiales bacterium]
MALVGLTFVLMILMVDLLDVYAREFEHGITNSKVERPEKEAPHGELHSMIATAYCLTGSTAMGTTPRLGVAASKPSWFGKKVNVYTNNNGQPGQLIGTYTIEDTGGEPIRTGSVIDIWFPTESECFEFGRKCVLVEVL